MKKKYSSPVLEMILLLSSDIIVASGGTVSDGTAAGNTSDGNVGELDPDWG